MLKSMTGYGMGEAIVSGKKISVEMKSVNHRYSDITVKTPRTYNFMEDCIRKAVADKCKRGKIDVYLNVETYSDDDKTVALNVGLAKQYITALHTMVDSLSVANDITACSLAKFPDVLQVQQASADHEQLKAEVLPVLETAISGFLAMRQREGMQLYQDLKERCNFILSQVALIEERAPGIVKEFRERIDLRIKELLGDTPYEESRLLTEVAVFADKVNVNEEIVRLKSHLKQMGDMLESSEPVGRKLDFLIQEMNREINTIGSKSNDLVTAQIVVEIKAEIEKLREQIQNIE